MADKGRILVVDDEKRITEMLQKSRSAVGYVVVRAHGGQEAIQRVAADPPDLILLDVMMPGIDGYEVCRRLKANPSTAIIPVIMTTAMTDRAQRLEGIAAGADDYLTKPVDHADMVLRVRNAI